MMFSNDPENKGDAAEPNGSSTTDSSAELPNRPESANPQVKASGAEDSGAKQATQPSPPSTSNRQSEPSNFLASASLGPRKAHLPLSDRSGSSTSDLGTPNDFPITLSQEEAPTPGELNKKLGEIGKRLAGPDFAAHLPAEVLAARGFASLRTLENSSRFELAKGAIEASSKQTRFPGDLRSRLFKLTRNLTRDEKQELIDWLQTDLETSDSRKGSYIAVILQSAANFRELYGLVRCSEPPKLRKLQSKELNQLVNEVQIVRRLRRLDTPRPLNNNATGSIITRKLDEIKASLQEELSLELGNSKRSAPANRMYASAQELLDYMSSRRRNVRGAKARRELANSMISLIRSHRHANLKISFEWRGSSPAATWSEKDAAALLTALRQLPETTVISTLKLTNIKRCKGSDGQTYGDRTSNGLVRIYDMAVDEQSAQAKYQGISSLKTTLVHELGHSLKFGRYGDGARRKEHIAELIRKSNSLFDFEAFVGLSDWKIMPSENYSIVEKGHAVEVDGHRYPLGKTVNFDGQQVHFSYDSGIKTLYHFRANADFPLDEYSQSSPWEDWAECFTEYIFLPTRLADLAPQKFAYFDAQFELYRDKARVQKKFESAMKRRFPAEPGEKNA